MGGETAKIISCFIVPLPNWLDRNVCLLLFSNNWVSTASIRPSLYGFPDNRTASNLWLRPVEALKLCLLVVNTFCGFAALFDRWKLNGTVIAPKSGARYSLSGGNLRISRLNKDEDTGTYQCLASNSFGTIVSREASLTFACKSWTCSSLLAYNQRYMLVVWKKEISVGC